MSNPYAPPGDDSQGDANQGRGNDRNMEPPQFGQRSDSWRAGSQQEQPGNRTPGSRQPGETPWPVYGQEGPTGQPQNPQGTGPQGPYQQPPYQPYGQPYPQNAPHAGSPYMRGQGGRPSGPPPSRSGAIWTLVIGILMMVLVAPGVFIGVTLSGVGLGSITDGSLYTTNSGTVTVDDTGVIGVTPAAGSASECTLTSADGSVYTMTNEDGAGIYIARGVMPGEYIVECEGLASGDTLVLFTGDMVNNLVNTAFAALGWATAVGVSGLVITIIGIVWLVRRNRARREFLYGGGY